LSEFTVSDDRATGTKAEILQGAVDVNIITDVGLGIEIVGGLGPLDLHLGAAVTETVRAQIRGCARRCVVIWIDGRSNEADGIAEWPDVIAEVNGASSKAVSGAGLKGTEGSSRDAAADAKVKGAVQIDLSGEVWAVVLRRYPGDVGIVRPNLVDVHDRSGCRRARVVRQANAVNVDLGRVLAGGVSGVQAEGVGIPRIKGCKGVAGGGPWKNDGRTDIVRAPEVVVEVTGVGRSRVPREGDSVSSCRRHAKVRGRGWPPRGGGRRTEDHCEDQNHCSEMGHER